MKRKLVDGRIDGQLGISVCGQTFCVIRPAYLYYRLWPGTKQFVYCIALNLGFKTELESIPRVFRSLVPQRPETAEAAAFHDKAYATGSVLVYCEVNGQTYERPLTRKEADLAFLLAMELGSTKKARKWALYWGVRAGGWVAWRKWRKFREEEARKSKLAKERVASLRRMF